MIFSYKKQLIKNLLLKDKVLWKKSWFGSSVPICPFDRIRLESSIHNNYFNCNVCGDYTVYERYIYLRWLNIYNLIIYQNKITADFIGKYYPLELNMNDYNPLSHDQDLKAIQEKLDLYKLLL